MNIDVRIFGYLGDGYIVCNACAEIIAKEAHEHQLIADDLPADDYRPTAEDYEAAGLSPLGAYSGLHDRACGETCDCGEVIVEEDDEHGLGIDGCDECGYIVPAVWAAVSPRRTLLGRFQTENEAEDFLWEYDERLASDGLPPLNGTVVELSYDDTTGAGGTLPAPAQPPLFEVVAELAYDPRTDNFGFDNAVTVDHLSPSQLSEVDAILTRAGY